MGFFDWFDRAIGAPVAQKGQTTAITTQEVSIPQRSVSQIRADLASSVNGGAALSAIQISAVYACARVIAEGLAQVPCSLQKATKAGHANAYDHPLFNVLARSPNDYMTSFELREWIGFKLVLTGNAYVFVARNNKGDAIELIPLPDGAVQIANPTFGEVTYTLNIKGQPTYGAANVWHLKGPSWNGITGLDPQQVAAKAIGLADDLQTFGEQVFANGAHPSGILTTDQVLTAEQGTALKKAWTDQQAGLANAGSTAVLSNGLNFQTIQTTADDAQFIEARKFQIEEICRMMRVDPLMVMQSTSSHAYASIEQRFLAHLTHTLQPWYVRFCQSAEASLLSVADQRAGYRVFLDQRSMVRASATDSANYYAIMRQNGLLTANECRDDAGLDRSDDPNADLLTPSANLYGPVKALGE